MDYEYSATMKKLLKKRWNSVVHIIFVLVIALLAAASVISYQKAFEREKEQREDVADFNPMVEASGLSELTPAYLFEGFATNFNDSIHYCFAFDEEARVYIVAIREKDMDSYKELIDYTYSEDMNAAAPEPVTLQGVSVPIEEEMAEFAVEYYNAIYGSEAVTMENYKFAFGRYFLDTTTEPEGEYSLVVLCVAAMLIALMFYLIYLGRSAKEARVSRATLGKYSGKALWDVDQEINDPSSIHYKKQKLYLTRNYIINHRLGLDIVPYEAVTHIYGNSYGGFPDKKRFSIIAETGNGEKHEFAMINYSASWETYFNTILAQLKERLPAIPFGFQDGFFTHVVKFDVEVDTGEEAEGKSSNVLLGIVGAILGAFLGGILWVIVGRLGFIAGLAGYVMMLLAISGYRRFSGFLDKKGQIISVIIALLMIYAANYAYYLIDIIKYAYNNSYTFSNIREAILSLPKTLKAAEVWGDFIKDLAIGYALSIWASVSLLRSIFTKNKKESVK